MKAILVIDEPRNCSFCPCYNDGYCNAAELFIDKDVPSWCPLKPMPSQKCLSLKDEHDDIIFQMGWNACLDEITGETE